MVKFMSFGLYYVLTTFHHNTVQGTNSASGTALPKVSYIIQA